MPLFNFSNDWETNKAAEKLCDTFIKDGIKYEEERRHVNKQKIKLVSLPSNEHQSVLGNTANKSITNFLGSKEQILRDLKKIADLQIKTNGRHSDQIPLNSPSPGKKTEVDSRKQKKSEHKKNLKRKRRFSTSENTVDSQPLIKKVKTKKKHVQDGTVSKNTNVSDVSTKKKRREKHKKNTPEDLSKNLTSYISKNNKDIVALEQVFAKSMEKIEEKIKKKEKKSTNKPLSELDKKKHKIESKIDLSQLKKGKKQLDILKKLVLQKQEINEPMLIKKIEPVLTLRQKMLQKLKAARFRFLNEQIYTTTSKETEKIFKSDPEAFQAYHEGYKLQLKRWPLNPLDIIVKSIKKMSKSLIIADFGCGEARLSKSVEQQVHSFDLVAVDDTVTACDMAHVPLEDASVDVAVFCLSLMGTNLKDYLMEANRVLKKGGVLKLAEVESRFDDVKTFTKDCEQFGFKKIWMDLSHNLFYFIDFKKETSIKGKKKLPSVTLQPCLYKKR